MCLRYILTILTETRLNPMTTITGVLLKSKNNYLSHVTKLMTTSGLFQ